MWRSDSSVCIVTRPMGGRVRNLGSIRSGGKKCICPPTSDPTTCSNYLVLRSVDKASTKSAPFCMTAFSASLINLTGLLPVSRDGGCYVSTTAVIVLTHWTARALSTRDINLGSLTLLRLKLDTLWNYSCYTKCYFLVLKQPLTQI